MLFHVPNYIAFDVQYRCSIWNIGFHFLEFETYSKIITKFYSWVKGSQFLTSLRAIYFTNTMSAVLERIFSMS